MNEKHILKPAAMIGHPEYEIRPMAQERRASPVAVRQGHSEPQGSLVLLSVICVGWHVVLAGYSLGADGVMSQMRSMTSVGSPTLA